jgi:hypothetical protein
MMNRTPEEVAALQSALLPEGSRQYYADTGLPRGTVYSTDPDGTERVIIPPAARDESKLPQRLAIRDILDPDIARAFAGTTSLNPMQSAVFETAFHSRDNVLVCGTFRFPRQRSVWECCSGLASSQPAFVRPPSHRPFSCTRPHPQRPLERGRRTWRS